MFSIPAAGLAKAAIVVTVSLHPAAAPQAHAARWVPIAVTGLVLLAVGATYEACLRDLGRLRATLGRMR
jgi:hypothetical protein